MKVSCDFVSLFGEVCELPAENVYVFTNNDGEEVFYYRCQFHPVAYDEHIEEAMSLKVKPLVMAELKDVKHV